MDVVILRAQAGAVKHSYVEPMSATDGGSYSLESAGLQRAADVADLRRDPSVVALAPVMPTRLIAPLASHGSDGWPWGVEAIGAEGCRYSGAGVKVAILDTGIDTAHEAFSGVDPQVKDFTGGEGKDTDGHGTHCAGVFFGRPVQGRRIGVAEGVTRPLVGKVLTPDGGDTRMLFEGISWAIAQRANILSLSMGIDLPRMVADLATELPPDVAASRGLDAYRDNLRLFDDLARLANSAGLFTNGTIIIAAAGNESRANEDPRFRIGASLPAAATGVISVGALEQAKAGLRVAGFSNAYPEVCAPGVDIISAQAGGGLVAMSGTSMAAPHVAGVAALWWEKAVAQGEGARAAKVVQAALVRTSLEALAPGQTADMRGAGLVRAPGPE